MMSYEYFDNSDADPEVLGTPQSFGGTSGNIEAPPLDSLPDLPDNSSEKGNSKQFSPDVPMEEEILKGKKTFDVSDYGKIMLAKEADRLDRYSKVANYDLEKSLQSERFYRLSLEEIARRTSETMFIVFNDMLLFFQKENLKGLTFNEKMTLFFTIFTQGDRMIYVGVFMIVLSLLFMLIFLSS
jgi:hypothetical protein